MKIFAFAGISDSGKTHLIRKLVGELKNREFTVSVIKHCARGFDIEGQGKDSAQFMEAGSDSVCMYSPDGMAVFQQKKTDLDVEKISRDYLKCCDFILVEGATSDKKLKKIEVLRKGFSEKIFCSLKELVAVVSDFDVGKNIPVFHPEEIEKIADFLENYPDEKEPSLWLDVDMAAGMIQKTGQDAGLQTYTPYKRPSLIQALFARISTDVDVGRIIESTHVHYKL